MQKRKYKMAAAKQRVATDTPRKSEPQPIELIMAARLARQLGISAVTFWRWRQMEGFPAGLRLRNHVYFSQADVQGWLRQQQRVA
jgi:predicted DNA-binding transcriptional regulator AlpA